MKIERKVIASGYDRLTCWVHARCGVRPANGKEESLFVTLQKSHMGSELHVYDVFSGLAMMRSDDASRTWSTPVYQPELSRWPESDGTEIAPCDFTPQWHSKTSRLLGIGCTTQYLNGRRVSPPRRRETVYSVLDEKNNAWSRARLLSLPEPERYSFCGAGCVQWEELPNGDILLPVYFADPGRLDDLHFSVTVLRCAFDGETLVVREIGDHLSLPVIRGFAEPSLIRGAGKYWLTLRNDLKAYVCVSDDGLHFDDPRPWTFCDGTEIGSCNTQQHWIRLQDRLFLIYTRSGLENDHVVRNRAPLLMGEVDQERRVVLRDSEQVLVPNRGAQLGNFGAVRGSSDSEAWICVSEWMENAGPWNREVWSALERRHPGVDLAPLAEMPGRCGVCELDGSDNSIHLVKVSLPK